MLDSPFSGETFPNIQSKHSIHEDYSSWEARGSHQEQGKSTTHGVRWTQKQEKVTAEQIGSYNIFNGRFINNRQIIYYLLLSITYLLLT